MIIKRWKKKIQSTTTQKGRDGIFISGSKQVPDDGGRKHL
jgi:hypothetical protein